MPDEELETAVAGAPTDDPRPPATFAHENGEFFVVRNVNGWDYMENGYFATGAWTVSSEFQQDILIPYHRVLWIRFDYTALNDYLDAP